MIAVTQSTEAITKSIKQNRHNLAIKNEWAKNTKQIDFW